MPKYGAHAFVWIPEWTTEKGNYAIAEAGKVGCDLIEITMLHPERFDAKTHKKALEDAGIEATVSLTLPADKNMTTNPQGAKDFLYLSMDKMGELGSDFLAGCIAYHLGTMTNEPPKQSERDIIIETLTEVAAEAKSRGITLSLEACNRYETYLYNTIEDTRATVRATGADNIGVHADTYHMNIEEEGFIKPFEEFGDAVNYVHMSESHRGLVGSGTVIWDDVFEGLKRANYTGPLVLESFAAINPDLLAATRLWRPPNQPSDVLAREGLKFLKAKAAEHGMA